MSAAFRFLTAGLLLAAAPTPHPLAADIPDWLIVPGARVGAIMPRCTLADVARAYGESNVRLKRRIGPEGQTGAIAAVVFPDDSLRRLEIVWADTVNLRYPRSIFFQGSTSVWHTAAGLTLGTSIAELESLNAKPFEFFGFGWDYGGRVTNWRGGTLARDTTLSIRLDALHLYEPKPYRSVMGDKKVSSANHLARELRPYVGEIEVRLPAQ